MPDHGHSKLFPSSKLFLITMDLFYLSTKRKNNLENASYNVRVNSRGQFQSV